MIHYDEDIIKEKIDAMIEMFNGDLDEHINGNGERVPYTKEETEHAIDVLKEIKNNLDIYICEYLSGHRPYTNARYDSVLGEVKLIRYAMKNKVRNNAVFQFDSKLPNRIPSRERLVSDLRKTLSIKTLQTAGNYRSQFLIPMLISKYDIKPEEWCKGTGDCLRTKFTPTVSKEELIHILDTSGGLIETARKLNISDDRIRCELIYYDIDVLKYKYKTKNGKTTRRKIQVS